MDDFRRQKDVTWELLNNIHDDLLGVLEDALHTAGNRRMEQEANDLYFSIKYLSA